MRTPCSQQRTHEIPVTRSCHLLNVRRIEGYFGWFCVFPKYYRSRDRSGSWIQKETQAPIKTGRIPNRCVIYMSFDRLPRLCKSRFGLHVRPLVERRLFAGRRAAARGEHPRVMARSHPASPPPGRPLRDPSAAHLETPYGKKDERHQPSDKLGPNSGGGRGAGHPWQPFSPTVRVLNTRPRLTRPPGRGARA